MIDLRLVFLHRCAAQIYLIENGHTDLDTAWTDIAEGFLKIPSEFNLLENSCEPDDLPF